MGNFKEENSEMVRFIYKMADVFKVLGDPTRLHLLGHIAMYNHHNQSLCVHDLAKELEVSESAISQHVRVLKGIGILDVTRKGFHKYYSVKFDVLKALLDDVQKLAQMAFTPCPEFLENGHKNCEECHDCPHDEIFKTTNTAKEQEG